VEPQWLNSRVDTIPNPGFYYWDKLTDNGWGQSPQFFRLESNDTRFENITLDSSPFYVEPHTYPTTTLHSHATPTAKFIYPLQEDVTDIYNTDTVTFEWRPPLQKGTNVIMTVVCEKYLLQTSSLFGKTRHSSLSSLVSSLTALTRIYSWESKFHPHELYMADSNRRRT
jgi:hypothetical protein